MARANKEDDREYGKQWYKALKERAEKNDSFQKKAIFGIVIAVIISLVSLWLSYANYIKINGYLGP